MEFKGLIGYSYLEVIGERNPITVNKPLYIIYNSRYCKLSIDGKVTYFNVDPSYTRELEKGDVVESFINDESETNVRGWFSIRIEHKKAGSSTLTVNLPMVGQIHAYVVNDAKIFSENGQVTGKVHIENWKELEARAKTADSLNSVRRKEMAPIIEKQRIQDSLNNLPAEVKYENQLNEGDNEYDLYFRHPDEHNALKKMMYHLEDSLLHDRLMGYPVLLYIDTTGRIVDCKAKAKWYEYAMPKLIAYFKNNQYRVSPYTYNDRQSPRYGRKYPAYISSP
jgi:hypothetical protein